MSNFAFLTTDFPEIANSAQQAERYVNGDPRTACFYARRALEQAVSWLFTNDPAFKPVYDNNLSSMLADRCFLDNVPSTIAEKAHLIRKLGNQAVHTSIRITPRDSFTVLKELFQFLYWLSRTYTRGDPRRLPVRFEESLIPPTDRELKTQTLAQLQALDEQLKARDLELRAQAQTLADYEQQIAILQAEAAAARAANARIEIPHEYTEAETRRYLIDLLLREAGWDTHGENVAEYEVTGMPNRQGLGYVDYVLWGDDGLPLGLVEAKRTSADPQKGKQQAKLYADCLERMKGQRPVIFYSNGYHTWLWDDTRYPPRQVQGFYTKDELALLVQRRRADSKLSVIPIDPAIADRYYQSEAIRSLSERFELRFRMGLLVMATGTGKTRVAIALVDLLMRAGWAKRVLFLADRTALVRQAVNAFKRFLPQSNPLNLLEQKEALNSRVVVSTYQTMLGMIDEVKENGQRQFGVGHFDLVIIDEAHRSVYHKFGAIFTYFDSLLVGLTATPKDDVDRNTYRLFELEDGVPTFNYDLQRAVADGFLVPPNPMSVPLKFQREGIHYNDLSEEEKLEWDLIDWHEDGEPPRDVDPAALNAWLFNSDTVDQVLKHLFEHGLKVKGGDRLGKTIIFAKNHIHAEFIQQRFDTNYPHLAGQFGRVIDNYQTYAQTLIYDFSKPEAVPHLAISVDMLDTGIDIPEVANLVFFKLVRSKTKFFQMLGRGTRLRPDLFGPGQDKEFFFVFDYCQNFEYFNENPQGTEPQLPEPLSQRLFKQRLELLEKHAALKASDLDAEELYRTLADDLHARVAAMPRQNFIVRPQLEYVDRYQARPRWEALSRLDYADLAQHLSGLPSQVLEEDETALRFDLLVLELQLSLVEAVPRFTRLRDRVIEIALQLATKTAIPMVHAQLHLIQQVQEEAYWEGMTLRTLEELRLGLRELVKFIDRQDRRLVYTDFKDELGAMQEAPDIVFSTGVNLVQYKHKVEEFIRAHQEQRVIRKIHFGIPLDGGDLQQLEQFLFQAGEVGGRQEFERAFGRQENLGLFIRRLVGLDRQAAKQAFAEYLDGKTFTRDQIQFINYIIDHLTLRGVMDPRLLYEAPYTDLNDRGIDGLFPGLADRLIGIIKAINQSVAMRGV
jgi:type I restriction enzyme, R subunit